MRSVSRMKGYNATAPGIEEMLATLAAWTTEPFRPENMLERAWMIFLDHLLDPKSERSNLAGESVYAPRS